MDTASLNTFLDRILNATDLGFILVWLNVTFVLNALIVLTVVVAAVAWIATGEPPIRSFLSKVIVAIILAIVINNWPIIAPIINRSGAIFGLTLGGGGFTIADLHNPARIGQVGSELFGRTVALSEGMNITIDFIPLMTIYLAALLVMFGFFALAVQLFLSLISFKIGSLMAFLVLPWGVFSGTAWVAERPLGWVITSAARLFALAIITSVSMTYVATLPRTFTLDHGGALNVMLFGLTMIGLATTAPALAKEVVSGRPNLSGSRR